jgi:Big-like domain-containing protein
MAVLMSLGGNTSGDGFLLAPLGTTYDVQLALWTDAGAASVTLQASPNPAGLVFSQTAINITTNPTIVTVHATLQSGSRGDTTIRVLEGAVIAATFAVTSIKHPIVNFRGRFEARFATDGSFYNRNPLYTAAIDNVVPPGWTWALEGEPAFVPAVGNVPENLETPVGRVIRFNNPVALRSHAAPVVSTVDSITGETSSGVETFAAGDPLIGKPVDLGSNTYLAGNQPTNPADPRPEEYWGAAREPMALFELHLGNLFGGASQVGSFTHKATVQNEVTRSPDSRPIANGILSAAAERAEFGLPTLEQFSETRIDLLVTDYNGLPAGASPQRRNLVRRIGHLLSAVSAAKAMTVQNGNPGVFTPRMGTLNPQGWDKEVYKGKVDANLVFQPGQSSVVAYLSEFQSFDFESTLFSFHSDELCGHHKGKLTPDLSFHGSYTGDPHTRTVDGTSYDFQAVGEFTLLRDGDSMEIQARQTPVPTQHPIADSYSGLTACVSVNTAIAARVGSHRVALQPGRERMQLQFYLDGKPARLLPAGIDLDGHRVTTFDANGETGLRVDYENGTVLTVTPAFWTGHGIWYLNIGVSGTKADEGIMGVIPRGSWLPRLRDGTTVGPRPASLHDRYVALYKTFADSWRVIAKTSLFVYASGTSTKTFTDTGWPANKPPCKLKPAFRIPGVPVHKSMPIEEAKAICNAVTMDDLNSNCVFDVATTGDEIFARGYLLAQELRLYGTSVQITGDAPPARPGRLPVPEDEPLPKGLPNTLIVTATVVPLTPGRPTPTGSVTIFVDGVPMKRPTQLDERGRARVTVTGLKPGKHKIRATYSGGGTYEYHRSSSPNLLHTVGRERRPRLAVRTPDR